MVTAPATATLDGVSLPYTTILRRQLEALSIGQTALIDQPIERVRRMCSGMRDRKFDLAYITNQATRATRIQWEPGGYRSWMLSLERNAPPRRLDNINVASIRAAASALGEQVGDRFTVTKLGKASVHVSRTEGRDKDGRRVYRFKALTQGDSFTAKKGEHSGLRSMHALCKHHSRDGRVFLARENIDGSITVRCYAEGGTPPKWQIDGEHARLQSQIEQHGAAAYSADDDKC